MGKHKPIYDAAGLSPFSIELRGMFYSLSFEADCGDYVVVTNAKKVKVSGRKEEQVLYRKHTMYPGGLKEIRYKEMMRRKPDEVRDTIPMNDEAGSPSFYRSFVRRYPGCCPKISCGRGD